MFKSKNILNTESSETILAGADNSNFDAILNKISSQNKKFSYNPTKIGKVNKTQNTTLGISDKQEISSKLVADVSNEFVN